jgi:hypothetical protein
MNRDYSAVYIVYERNIPIRCETSIARAVKMSSSEELKPHSCQNGIFITKAGILKEACLLWAWRHNINFERLYMTGPEYLLTI